MNSAIVSVILISYLSVLVLRNSMAAHSGNLVIVLWESMFLLFRVLSTVVVTVLNENIYLSSPQFYSGHLIFPFPISFSF